MNRPDTVFSLHLSIDADLTVDELWPDGDAPETPSVEAVQRLIRDCGGTLQVLKDWNLVTQGDEFDVHELVVRKR